jgi:ATP/maltotriose-dependent transcriptional regulator MalT
VVSRERLVRSSSPFANARSSASGARRLQQDFAARAHAAQWLAAGACAAWLALDENDAAGRFVEALLLSTFTALGRPAPASAVEEALRSAIEPREAISALLGDLADAARSTALVLDDVHALPEAVGAELLPYLAFNLPPNVHLILGTPPVAVRDLGPARPRPVRFV